TVGSLPGLPPAGGTDVVIVGWPACRGSTGPPGWPGTPLAAPFDAPGTPPTPAETSGSTTGSPPCAATAPEPAGGVVSGRATAAVTTAATITAAAAPATPNRRPRRPRRAAADFGPDLT